MTPAGRATFWTGALPESVEHQTARNGKDVFVLQTFRSHDQYNTTVYGMNDRYRGIYGERNVVFMNQEDIDAIGARIADRVDVVGVHEDGRTRVAADPPFRLVPYDIPRGCVAGYYPELNVLVPLGTAGDMSDTPASKWILVRFAARAKAA